MARISTKQTNADNQGRRHDGRSLDPDPTASTCDTYGNRADPLTLSRWWGSHGHTEPFEFLDPSTKIPAAVAADNLTFQIVLRCERGSLRLSYKSRKTVVCVVYFVRWLRLSLFCYFL